MTVQSVENRCKYAVVLKMKTNRVMNTENLNLWYGDNTCVKRY